MILNQLNPTSFTKVEKLNKLLSEQFGIKVTPGKASKKKLVKIRENADMALVKLRNSNRQFQALFFDPVRIRGISIIIIVGPLN